MGFFSWLDDTQDQRQALQLTILELKDELSKAKMQEYNAMNLANDLAHRSRIAELCYVKAADRVRDLEDHIRGIVHEQSKT